ncbi:hypothetical protein [uncultured Deinococcus sp.]|nr:hypothetical protein [uncultured Deinococcus sp.]
MRSLIRQLFPRPVSTSPAPRTTLPQTAGLQIVVPVIRVSDLPRR